MRRTLVLGFIGSLIYPNVQATNSIMSLDWDTPSHIIKPLPFQVESSSLVQIEFQERRLKQQAEILGKDVSITDLRASLCPFHFINGAATCYNLGVRADSDQEKYHYFQKAINYVMPVWLERERIYLPKELIGSAYYASLYAKTENTRMYYFSLWRSWEEAYGEDPVINAIFLKGDARIIFAQANKIYDQCMSNSISIEEGSSCYINLILKAGALWREVIRQTLNPTSSELLECLEVHLSMRHFSCSPSEENTKYTVQIFEEFAKRNPPTNFQECVHISNLSYALAMFFNNCDYEVFDQRCRPRVLKEKHLNTAYHYLQKIQHVDLLSQNDLMQTVSLYRMLGDWSYRSGFTQVCYERAVELLEIVLGFSLEKKPILQILLECYESMDLSLLYQKPINDMFFYNGDLYKQKWDFILENSPNIEEKTIMQKTIMHQRYLSKIEEYSNMLN